MNTKTAHHKEQEAEQEICIAMAISFDSSNDDEQLVQIFPSEREWFGADGRGPFRLSNPESVAALSNQSNLIKGAMIDRDHQRQLAPKGSEVVAAGWFKQFVFKDGTMYGLASWTPKAKQQLADKEYRFFSASFTVNRATREVIRITGGTLTNTPNFPDMEALASKQTQPCNKEILIMDENTKQLATRLGLDAEKATLEDVVASAMKTLDVNDKHEEALASVRQNLKLDADCAIEEVVAAAQPQQDIDLGAYVPKATFEELASQLADFNQKEIEHVVASAMSEGKVSPSMKDWAEEYASKDMAGFKAFVQKTPKIVADKTAGEDQGRKATSQHSDGALELASRMGLSEDDLVTEEAV